MNWKKCFWPYHVTYQPIHNSKRLSVWVTLRWVIRAQKERISIIIFSIHNFANYGLQKMWPSVNFLTFEKFLWKWMHWTSVVWHTEAKITTEMNFSWVTWELGLAKVFWMLLVIYKLMTSQLWIIVIEHWNENFRSTSSHINGRNPFILTHRDIKNDFQKIVFWGEISL